jgi:hypothetical protein
MHRRFARINTSLRTEAGMLLRTSMSDLSSMSQPADLSTDPSAISSDIAVVIPARVRYGC